MSLEDSLGFGILTGFFLNFTALFLGIISLSWIKGEAGRHVVMGMLFIGVLQAVYLLPLYLYLRKSAHPKMAQGLFIAALSTVLLNAGCWAYVLFS